MAVEEHKIFFPKHMRWAYRCQFLLLTFYFEISSLCELNMLGHLVASGWYNGTGLRNFNI